MALIVEPDKCRVCGCTTHEPCVLPDGYAGETCSWLDFDHTLCTNPLCVGAIPLRELLEMPILRRAA